MPHSTGGQSENRRPLDMNVKLEMAVRTGIYCCFRP